MNNDWNYPRIKNPLAVAGFIVLAAMLVGCGSPGDRSSGALPGGFVDAGSLAVERAFTIGEETGTLFGQIGNVVANDQGQIFAADIRNTHIRVFESDGDSLTTIGRKGQGPGEFTDMWHLAMTKHFLAAVDRHQDKISLFEPTPPFSPISTFALPRQESGYPRWFVGADTSRLIMEYGASFREVEESGLAVRNDAKLISMDTEGHLLQDSILVVPGDQVLTGRVDGALRSMSWRFSHEPQFAYDGEHLYYGRTDSLRVGKYNLQGEKVDEVHLPYEYMPIMQAEIDSMIARMGGGRAKILQTIDLPDTRQAFLDLVVDDRNRLWIPAIDTPNDGWLTWKIVDFDARRVWTIKLPEHSVRDVRDGRIYTVHTDEFGVQEVVIYRIVQSA